MANLIENSPTKRFTWQDIKSTYIYGILFSLVYYLLSITLQNFYVFEIKTLKYLTHAIFEFIALIPPVYLFHKHHQRKLLGNELWGIILAGIVPLMAIDFITAYFSLKQLNLDHFPNPLAMILMVLALDSWLVKETSI